MNPTTPLTICSGLYGEIKSVRDARGDCVCTFPWKLREGVSTNEEKAAFIVRACNSRAALVAALSDAAEVLALYSYACRSIKSSPFQPQLNGANALVDVTREKIRAAINAAKGVQS